MGSNQTAQYRVFLLEKTLQKRFDKHHEGEATFRAKIPSCGVCLEFGRAAFRILPGS